MSTGKKRRGSARNVVYSSLVFLAICLIGNVILAPDVIKKSGDKTELSVGSILAFGIAIIVTVVFSIWFQRFSNGKPDNTADS